MSIFQRITALFAKKYEIDKKIATLQKSCKHSKKSVKQVRERLDSSTTVIRWVCDECFMIVGYPSDKDREKFFKE